MAVHWTPSFYMFALLSIVCSSAAQVCQKSVAIQSGAGVSTWRNPLLILSVGLLALGLVAWLIVLANTDVSIAYPLLSANYLLVLLAARFIFKEPVPIHRWIGSAVMVVGIMVLMLP